MKQYLSDTRNGVEQITRTIVCLASFIFFVLSTNSIAQNNGTGFGVIIGEPVGVSFKTWTEEWSAIDGALSWSPDTLTAHLGLVLHKFDERLTHQGVFSYYYGAGTRFRAAEGDPSRLGVRGVIGLAYFFDHIPLEIFLEIGPVMNLIPSTELEMTGGMGVRFYLF